MYVKGLLDVFGVVVEGKAVAKFVADEERVLDLRFLVVDSIVFQETLNIVFDLEIVVFLLEDDGLCHLLWRKDILDLGHRLFLGSGFLPGIDVDRHADHALQYLFSSVLVQIQNKEETELISLPYIDIPTSVLKLVVVNFRLLNLDS